MLVSACFGQCGWFSDGALVASCASRVQSAGCSGGFFPSLARPHRTPALARIIGGHRSHALSGQPGIFRRCWHVPPGGKYRVPLGPRRLRAGPGLSPPLAPPPPRPGRPRLGFSGCLGGVGGGAPVLAPPPPPPPPPAVGAAPGWSEIVRIDSNS